MNFYGPKALILGQKKHRKIVSNHFWEQKLTLVASSNKLFWNFKICSKYHFSKKVTFLLFSCVLERMKHRMITRQIVMNFYGSKELILRNKKHKKIVSTHSWEQKMTLVASSKKAFLKLENWLQVSFFKKSHIFTPFLRFGEIKASYDHDINCDEFLWTQKIDF